MSNIYHRHWKDGNKNQNQNHLAFLLELKFLLQTKYNLLVISVIAL